MSSNITITLCPPPSPTTVLFQFKQQQQMPNETTTTTINQQQQHQRQQIQLEECKWASAYPEIQKACYLSRVCLAISPKSCRLKNISPILQEGPTCGLAAVSMLTNGQSTTDELLTKARRNFFTKNGEMFSAQNLYELLNCVMINDGQQIRTQLYDGRIYSTMIKQVLQNGGCLLVPYDPDFNHAPCLKNGHKAHWALIIGYLIDDNDKFFVFSRHGKTRNIAVWSLKALSASNANLNEFEQPKGYPHAEFLLPVGGIGGDLGLKNKCIIIERLTNFNEIIIK